MLNITSQGNISLSILLTVLALIGFSIICFGSIYLSEEIKNKKK